MAMTLVIGLAATGDALAAPYVGAGQAAIPEGGDRVGPRRDALIKARKAALEAALAELRGVDPAGRKRVLDSASAWTSAYRVLKQSDDGATATVEVEVEIDLPRIEKLLVGVGAPVGGVAPPRLGEVRGEACGDELATGARQLMAARDLASLEGEASAVMNVRLRCEALGEVYQARAHGSRVTISTQVGAEPPIQSTALAFAEDPQAAELEALRRALAELSEIVRKGRDTAISLEIAAPWPAARIRRLERAIGSSIVGVRSVSLGGITPQGAVILRIDGGSTLVAQDLAMRMEALRIPGAPLRILEVRDARRIAATF